MSQWTHVNCIFRLDGLESRTNKKLKEIFGKAFDYDRMHKIYAYKGKILPCGSEGTLELKILKRPKDNCAINFAQVVVFGDLRDYDDETELEQWFDDTVEKLSENDILIRQAIMQIDIERTDKTITYMVMYNGRKIKYYSPYEGTSEVEK